MEDLLISYIKWHVYDYEYIKIYNYSIDGASCFVEYNTDDSGYYKEVYIINIWDMFAFKSQEQTPQTTKINKDDRI